METFITSLLRILEFILALGLLIFLHELGHYIASKLFKIEVEEFGFGFPPRAVKLFQFRETEFTLNWIPFGAFVRPKGENDPEVPGGMAAAKPLVRFAVLLGGPLMNLLTASHPPPPTPRQNRRGSWQVTRCRQLMVRPFNP